MTLPPGWVLIVIGRQPKDRQAVREHQIAISLKPQQFELLQRLARERGFKSVTAYVKQKIVELALGLDSDDNGGDESNSNFRGGDYAQVLGELGRIHDELRGFISPSLQAEIDAGTKIAAMAQGFDAAPPGINQTAVNAASPSSPGALVDGGLTGRDQSQPATAPAQAEPAKQPVSNQVLPSQKNLGGFGFRLGGFNLAKQAAQFQPPVENADKLSGYKEVMDDLEELADRAFAISPRLGALDESAPAEAATGRGGRGGETILVEPILPNKNVKAKEPPISMVPPVSPANLPGPEQMQKAATAPVVPVRPAKNAEVAQLLPAVETVKPAPAQAVSVSVPAPVPSPVASAPVPSAPVVAVPVSAPVIESPVVAAAPAPPPEPPAPEPEPPPPAPPQPQPGDDLLSELLDENLVAHSSTPRSGENPFAVGLPFARNADEQSIEEETTIEPATAPPQVEEENIEEEQVLEPPAAVIAPLVEEPAPPPPVEESPAAPPLTPAPPPAAEEEKQASPVQNDPAQIVPRISNISGGPPPRRRRT